MNLDNILNDLEHAMEKWFAAKQAHDEAFAEFEDYSWDYYGANFIKDMDNARQEYRELFIKAINAQIEEDKKKDNIKKFPDNNSIKNEIKRLIDLL